MSQVLPAAAVAFSLVLLSARCHDDPDGAGKPPQGPQVLNLQWETRDPNGLPVNPRWAFQEAGEDGQLPLADPEWQCGGFPTNSPQSQLQGDPRCTDQQTGLDLPTGWHKPVCGAEFLLDQRWGKLRGHVNWRPVTVQGFLTWNSRAGAYPFGDGDYTLSLEPAESDGTTPGSGLTRYNTVEHSAMRAYHIEYNGEETIAHFTHDWWAAHRARAADGDVHTTGAAEPGQIRDGSYAVVAGLFGLDAEHKGFSELHPVHALSVLTSCDEEPDGEGFFDDEWAVFVRNWGNEGFCADWNAYHMLDLPDEIYAFRVPLPGLDPSSVAVGSRTRFFANYPRPGQGTRPGRGPFLVSDGEEVEVRFQLPEFEGPLTRSNDPARIHGLLHLRWKAIGGGSRQCPGRLPTRETAALTVPAEPTGDGEDILRLMSADRRARGLALPDDSRDALRTLDAVEVTDRDPIPAPVPAEIPDRLVPVPKRAGPAGALALEVDEPPPAEVCDSAHALLSPERSADLTEDARRRMEELRAYCVRTRRAEAQALYRSALEAPDSAERVEAWLATLPRVDGYFVIEGDIKVTEEQLRASLRQEHREPREPSLELSVNLADGVPTYWKDPESRRLTYAVDRRSFPDAASHTEIVTALAKAAGEWEEVCPACGISFVHLVEQDDAPSHEVVTFIVRYRDERSGLVAIAFYPNDPPLARYLDIYPNYFVTSYDGVGVLRHELGHVLGYRHAHLGVPGCIHEGGEWLALTPYDSRSVMHYLCGGAGDLELAISDLDRQGHRQLYGDRE
jgi:hypothetical protein